MELSSNKMRCASGSKWKVTDKERERERQERQYKMPINFYCCVMKVWWMQREGTRETELSLCFHSFLFQTPRCRCQLLKICNLKINICKQTERPLSWWSGNKVVYPCMWRSHIIHTCKYLWGKNLFVSRAQTTNGYRNPMKHLWEFVCNKSPDTWSCLNMTP